MSASNDTCFLCVHVPEFAMQARLRHRLALRTKAVAILDGLPPLQTVCSTNRLARSMGVDRGTTRAEMESFAGVEVLQRSRQEEESAASALLIEVGKFSPHVEVLAARDGAHRLVVDIAGSERAFGVPERIAQNVLEQARSLGLLGHVAVSANFHAAVCMAAYSGAMPRLIVRGREREALAPLPLEAIETLTEEQRDTFALWGVHALGEIAALPETQLVARMGQAGKQAWLLARGEHGHLLIPQEERFTLEERTEFDSPVEVLDSLLFVLGPMLDQLTQRATSHALALASVTLHLKLTSHAAEASDVAEQARDFACSVKPALPVADSRILLKLLHLELQAHPPGAPVIAAHVEAEPGDRARAQLGLFSPQLPEPSRLDVTLARIRGFVGEGRVGRPRLLDSHQPDSFVMDTFSVPALSTSGRQARHPQAMSAGPSSSLGLRRLRPPVLLRMCFVDDQPMAFYLDGKRYEVAAAFGPWEHGGNWWSTTAWSCEEWDVTATAADGSSLFGRIARDLLHPQWRLEGVYD